MNSLLQLRTDKAGNSSTAPVTGELLNITPSDLTLQVYEDRWDWENKDTGIDGNQHT